MLKRLLGIAMMFASSIALAVPAAYVHEMTGSGSATMKGQSRPLALGGILESGDVISVAKGGSMTVKFEDGQVVVLQENSRFAIEKYDYNKQKVAESSAVMSLLSGGMRFITGVIGGTRKDAIAMKAGTATIGIRGTDLAITIAGVNYVVTVQDGGIVLSRPGLPPAPVNQGQGLNAPVNQPAQAVPVVQLPATVLAAVSATVQKAVPATNPVGVQQQATLVQAVAKAAAIQQAAAAPNATEAQKAEAAVAAREVAVAITAALQATQTAIVNAINAGATQTTAQGTAAKAPTAPGVSAPVGRTEAQAGVAAVQAINTILPPTQQLTTTELNTLQTTVNTLSPTPTTTTTTTPTTTPTTTDQQILLQAPVITNPPPPTCGGVGQSPC